MEYAIWLLPLVLMAFTKLMLWAVGEKTSGTGLSFAAYSSSALFGMVISSLISASIWYN